MAAQGGRVQDQRGNLISTSRFSLDLKLNLNCDLNLNPIPIPCLDPNLNAH